MATLVPIPQAIPAKVSKRRVRRPPVFLPAQATCLTCNEEIRDALVLELMGRFCSPRCYHARELPRVWGLGA